MWSVREKIFLLWLLPASALRISAATYWGDIEPLLARHCVGCHQAGEVGPFVLDSYAAAKARAKTILAVTASGYMPPWKPSALSVPFHEQRRLSAAEKLLLSEWVKGGALEGTARAKTLPPRQSIPAADAVWRMPQPFSLAATGTDEYRCFVVPSPGKDARWVNGFRFSPGNRRIVHHALVFFDLSGAARRLDAEAEGPGYPCFGTPGFLPTASLGGWSPGNGRLQMPPDTAVKLAPGADIVFQIHYQVTGKVETDQSGVEVWFASGAPAKRLLDVALTSNRIDIPAGVAAYKVTDYFELPVDVTLWQIIPHAHLIARRIRGWATLPGAARKVVLAIDDWDFQWQDVYRLVKPLKLPAGTLIEMEVTYDNSKANPRNPNQPPQRVVWGPGVKDEMAGLHWNVTVDDEAEDLEELTQSLWGKMIRLTRGQQLRKP
jgi:hypothetical protein